jgi:hypothetical protein
MTTSHCGNFSSGQGKDSLGLFQFRSVDRDRRSDLARLEPIRTALAAALSSLDSEIAGIIERREAAREQVSMLIGSESGLYYEREAPEEKLLSAAERELMNATRRVAELERQRDRLREMDVTLKSLY